MQTDKLDLNKLDLNFKNIIIWRHAEAHPAEMIMDSDDMSRALTPKGRQQAKRMADWLNRCLPDDLMLVSGPALRAYQTAQALKREIMIDESLEPSANLQAVLDSLSTFSASKDSSKNCLIVGHQPWLWQLVAHLTGFAVADINIKKGAVWWLRQSSADTLKVSAHYNVIAVQSPRLLG